MNKTLSIMLIFTVCLGSSACNEQLFGDMGPTGARKEDSLLVDNGGLAVVENAPAEEKTSCKDLLIVIDTSGSANKTQILQVVDNICVALPTIVKQMNVAKIRLICFGADAWSSADQLAFEMPSRRGSSRHTGNYGEFQILKNIRDAQREQDSIQAINEEEKASEAIREGCAKIRSVLGVKVRAMLNSGRGSRCSDVNGAIRRGAWEMMSNGSIVIIITDAVENCSKSLNMVDQPKGEGALLVVLVSEDPNDAGSTDLSKETGWKQFETRKRDFARMMPWINVLPPYHTNYSQNLLGQTPQ